MYQFSGETDNFDFFGPNLLKIDFGSEFQKSKSGFGISTSEFPEMSIFKQNRQPSIFWPKFGEIAWYVRYWGSNNVGGVAGSWVEAQMSWLDVDEARFRLKWAGGDGWSWVEVDGSGAQFSNT